MVLFDNNVLCLALHPDVDVPNDPATGAPVDRAADRVQFLMEQLKDRGERIVLPTPVLSEFLTFAAPDYLLEIAQSMWFAIEPFDQRAAVEAAIALKRDLAPGGKGKTLGLPGAKWQKIKVDRQIVAIGKVHSVTAVYSTDRDVLALAASIGLKGIHVADLPYPPQIKSQMSLEDLLTEDTSPDPPDPESA